jgi:hypothetical protein
MEQPSEARGLTRSGLIKAGAAAALAVGASGTGAALAGRSSAERVGAGIKSPKGGPAYLRRSSYVPLVGTTFRFHVPGAHALRLKLVEARALRGPGESFSLLFRGRRGVDLKGGTYRIDHLALGSFELFVNPVGRGVKGLDLEAVVNRIAT